MGYSFKRVNLLESSSEFTTVDLHAAGAPLRLVIEGFAPIPGKTMQEKFRYVSNNYVKERNALMREPRGHSGMVGALVTEPIRKEAEFGLIFMAPSEFWGMCGHGVIATVTGMIKLGELQVEGGGSSEVEIDTPFGPITAIPNLKEREVKEVTLKNVPSFYKEAVEVNLEELSKLVKIDISYGGGFVGIVQAKELGLEVKLGNIEILRNYSKKIMTHLVEDFTVEHPQYGEMPLNTVRIVQKEGDVLRNAMFFEDGSIDRSPCGTGTSAHMAAEYAKGRVNLRQQVLHKSIIGTEFKSELIEENKQWGISTVVPTVTGSAYLTGLHKFIRETDDPFNSGFKLD